jgi:hypothetical protein
MPGSSDNFASTLAAKLKYLALRALLVKAIFLYLYFVLK